MGAAEKLCFPHSTQTCAPCEHPNYLIFFKEYEGYYFNFRLRLKQNRYPVLLLTQGINSKYEDYLDPRTWTVKNGSNFAAMADILGVSAMAEDIKRDPGQVSFVKDRGQVMFVWTDDQNDSGTVKYLKELGVDGIIYDRCLIFNYSLRCAALENRY